MCVSVSAACMDQRKTRVSIAREQPTSAASAAAEGWGLNRCSGAFQIIHAEILGTKFGKCINVLPLVDKPGKHSVSCPVRPCSRREFEETTGESRAQPQGFEQQSKAHCCFPGPSWPICSGFVGANRGGRGWLVTREPSSRWKGSWLSRARYDDGAVSSRRTDVVKVR